MSRFMRTGIAAAAIAGLALTGCSASASNVPAFDDVEGDMWESMADSQAMGMSGVLPAEMASDAELIDMLGGNLADLQIYGSLAESATAVSLGEGEAPLMYFFGEDVYVSTDMMLEMINTVMMSEATETEHQQMQQATAELAGKYFDVSEEYAGAADSLDMSAMLDEMRSAAESDQADDVTNFNFGELQQEGSYQQLDMESDDTGWFYSIDGEDENAIMNGEAEQFIAIATDQDAPRLIEVRNGDTAMEFSWDDEVEVPQRPSDDQIVTEEDVMGMDLGM